MSGPHLPIGSKFGTNIKLAFAGNAGKFEEKESAIEGTTEIKTGRDARCAEILIWKL